MPVPTEEERNAQIYRLRMVNRLTCSEIGERFGISHQRVSQIVDAVEKSLPPVDYEALRRRSMELHEATQRMALELAEREGAPVTAGKDGDLVVDPSTGKYVRDYSLRLQALEAARKADVEIRKLMGLDAATKQEVSGSIKYEVAGVDVNLLS